MHNHLRQNMCPAHQNRSLANGPSHPRLDPEEIQMADVRPSSHSPCVLLSGHVFCQGFDVDLYTYTPVCLCKKRKY